MDLPPRARHQSSLATTPGDPLPLSDDLETHNIRAQL